MGICRAKRYSILLALSICCFAYLFISQIISTSNKSSVTIPLSPTKLPVNTTFIIKSRSILFLDELLLLQRKYFTGFGNGTIPKIVHITYKSNDVPKQYETYFINCMKLNPDVAFLFWTDTEAEKFVQQQTSRSANVEEKRLYHILTTYHGVEKADVLRLMLIYFIGGIYMDLDTECKSSFSEIHMQLGHRIPNIDNGTMLAEEISCLLDQEQWLQTRIHWRRQYCAMNNLMICRPRHPFFRYILSQLKEDDKKTFIMDKTGPFLLTKRYEEYIHLSERENNSLYLSKNNSISYDNPINKVILAHPDWFSPLVDFVDQYATQCQKYSGNNVWFKEGCTKDLPHYKNTIKERTKNAFLIHRFLHLGYSYNHHLIKQHFPIHSVDGVYVVSLT